MSRSALSLGFSEATKVLWMADVRIRCQRGFPVFIRISAFVRGRIKAFVVKMLKSVEHS